MIAAVFVLFAEMAAAPPASAPPPPPLIRPAEPVPPRAVGAATLVATEKEAIRAYDMDMGSARGRIAGEVWPQIEALRERFARRLAGIYFDGDGALVLRLLGDKPVADRLLRGKSGALPVRFRTGWRLTDKQVMRKLHPMLPELRRRLPNMTSATVDERTGMLFLIVPGFDAATKAREKELSKLIGAPVWIGVPR